MIPPLNPDFTKIPLCQAIRITGWSCGVLESRLQNSLPIHATGQVSCLDQSNAMEPLFAFIDNFAYFFRADLAMRGSAISVLMRACVAFLESFLAFFWGMRP